MRTLTAQQSNILDSNAKIDFSWLFEVDTDDDGTPEYYWSTKAKSYGGQSYTFKVMNFSPIRMRRGSAENDNIQTPAEITIIITNADNALVPSNFEGGSILVRMVMEAELGGMEEAGGVWQFEAASGDGLEAFNSSEDEICSWRIRIKAAYNEYQKLILECQDWLAPYLEGDYPNTPLIQDLWPSDDPQDDNICVPLVFGTSYFPVRSAYITDARYYVLGPSTPTYTISKIRSPRDWGAKSEWSSSSYTFTQSNKTGRDGNSYKVVQFIIADSDNDGTPDVNGLFRQGERFLDVPCKYNRSDLSAMTAPGNIIEYILEDMGVPNDKIDDTSKIVANAYYSSWGLSFNVGLWYKISRKEFLARLLTMCNTELIVRDKIYFKIHDKAIKFEIEKDLVRNITGGEGSFSYNPALKEQGRDSGYVAYRDADEPIDSLMKILVPAKGSTTNNISKDIVRADYVQDSQNVQRIGTLAFQRRFMKDASIRFETKAKAMHLECDDILQINPMDYGAGIGSEYNVLIDEMTIHHDGHLEFGCMKFSIALDNWGDLNPSSITIAADDSSYVYEPSITGPDSPGQTGSSILNLIRGRMRIGDGNEYIMFDPSIPLQSFIESGITRLKVGDLGSSDFGIELLDHSGDSIMKLDGSGNKYISNISMINNLVLGDGGSNPGTLTLQIAAGQGDTYISAGKTDFTNVDNGFILGIDDSDSDHVKFLLGDDTNYLNWDGTGMKIYISSSDALEIDAGGDIKLVSDDADPGIIKFVGTSYTTELGSFAADGSDFLLSPDTDNAINFAIGDGNHMMSFIKMYARGNIELWEEYSTNQHARIFLQSTVSYSKIDFYLTDGGTLQGLVMYYNGVIPSLYLGPYDDNIWDLGTSAARWKNIYPVKIFFVGSSYTNKIEISADGSNAFFQPEITQTVNCYIGNTNNLYNMINLFAYGVVNARSYYSATQRVWLSIQSTSSSAFAIFNLMHNSTTRQLAALHDASGLSFAPYDTDNDWNLGKVSLRWKNLYMAGNCGIGASYWGTNADQVLGIGNGTAPTSSPIDMIQIFSTDISGDDATLGLRTEATVATDTDETKFSHKLPVKINGSTYYIMLTNS